MKHIFEIICSECSEKMDKLVFHQSEVIMTNLGVYEVTCNNGHKIKIVTQNEKFELLFTFGAMALNDGYYREAVADFATSLERFFEMCIKVFLSAHDISVNNVESTWKYVSNSSERQLGAFYCLYLANFNKEPPITKKFAEFRNKVVHKGEIPTYDDVIKHAELLYNLILDIIDDLKLQFREDLMTVHFNNSFKREKEKHTKDITSVSTVYLGTTISLLWDGERKSFREALNELKLSKALYFKS